MLTGLVESAGADVDRLVENARLPAGRRFKQQARLGSGSGAELDEGHICPERIEDLVGMGGEDVSFGAGEVVLGQFGDLLKERRADLIIKKPRRQSL